MSVPRPLPLPIGKPPARWQERWKTLAGGVGLDPARGVLVALSGGADSVLLAHLVAASEARPRSFCVHVDHGLRAAESQADAAFCSRLCAELGLRFVRRRIVLDERRGDLEARARRARYRTLAREAQRVGIGTIVTGHHADDALETLLMRWMRGSTLAGLPGLRARNRIWASAEGARRPLEVVRPLVSLTREEVRQLLRAQGLSWREDSSNQSSRFTRNRVRLGLRPWFEAGAGPEALRNLRAFGDAIERFEESCAALTAGIGWRPPLHAPASRTQHDAHLGGWIERAALAELPVALSRRTLFRLLCEATGKAPPGTLIERFANELASGGRARHALPGGWSLRIGRERVELEPPPERLAKLGSIQAELPFPDSAGMARARAGEKLSPEMSPHTRTRAGESPEPLRLAVPGRLELADGRVLTAEILVDADGQRPIPAGPLAVELDAQGLATVLAVRHPRAGDRFHGLGAPGSRRLGRFLRDAGVPARERQRVPLVFSGEQLIWVCGLRPGHAQRVRAATRRRLRLELSGGAPLL